MTGVQTCALPICWLATVYEIDYFNADENLIAPSASTGENACQGTQLGMVFNDTSGSADSLSCKMVNTLLNVILLIFHLRVSGQFLYLSFEENS